MKKSKINFIAILYAVIISVAGQSATAQITGTSLQGQATVKNVLLTGPVNEYPTVKEKMVSFSKDKRQGAIVPGQNFNKVSSVSPAKPNEMPKAKRTFIFTGRGNWLNADNWKGNQIPPAILKAGDCVIIDGSDFCIFNFMHPFVITKGSTLIVNGGKKFYINIGNFFSVDGGTVTNNGELNIVSGTLKQPLHEGVITNNGKLSISALAKSEAKVLNNPVTKQIIN